MKQFHNENWDGISRKNANINETSASDAHAADTAAARFHLSSRNLHASRREVAAQKIALDKAKATLVAATATLVAATKSVADLTASHAKAIQAYNTAAATAAEEQRAYRDSL